MADDVRCDKRKSFAARNGTVFPSFSILKTQFYSSNAKQNVLFFFFFFLSSSLAHNFANDDKNRCEDVDDDEEHDEKKSLVTM